MKNTMSAFIGQFSQLIRTHQSLLSRSFSVLVIAACATRWYFKRLRKDKVVIWSKAKPKAKVSEFMDPEFNIRLTLAKQYIAIQDPTRAKQVLEAVMTYGNQKEKKAAEDLLHQIS
jgi:FimV-like protein